VNRKQRRAAQRLARKGKNKDLESKMKLYSDLPDTCSACSTSFDKTDDTMLDEWIMVVREDEKQTRLYCPPCWSKAKTLIEKVKEEI